MGGCMPGEAIPFMTALPPAAEAALDSIRRDLARNNPNYDRAYHDVLAVLDECARIAVDMRVVCLSEPTHSSFCLNWGGIGLEIPVRYFVAAPHRFEVWDYNVPDVYVFNDVGEAVQCVARLRARVATVQ